MTKKNDRASSTAASSMRQTGEETGTKTKKAKKKSAAAAGREAVAQLRQPERGPQARAAREDRQEPGGRGRLLARVTSAVSTGVQLVPQLEDLHSGLLLASLVLLGIDVIIDIGMSAISASGRLLRTLRTSMKREMDGSIVAVVRIAAPVGRGGHGLRITGRIVSSLLIAGSTIAEGWQRELLIAALVTLTVDVVSESITLLIGYLRTQWS
ncbi:hypothetical protein WB401_44840 [Streptomyces brasiliscabiei]|uniref:Integral membrane protein n=1 Tax=Streptomyces brasiliscabiei TaxID=2736302 RepID=A0ABU8GW80_9ACTN